MPDQIQPQRPDMDAFTNQLIGITKMISKIEKENAQIVGEISLIRQRVEINDQVLLQRINRIEDKQKEHDSLISDLSATRDRIIGGEMGLSKTGRYILMVAAIISMIFGAIMYFEGTRKIELTPEQIEQLTD